MSQHIFLVSGKRNRLSILPWMPVLRQPSEKNRHQNHAPDEQNPNPQNLEPTLLVFRRLEVRRRHLSCVMLLNVTFMLDVLPGGRTSLFAFTLPDSTQTIL